MWKQTGIISVLCHYLRVNWVTFWLHCFDLYRINSTDSKWNSRRNILFNLTMSNAYIIQIVPSHFVVIILSDAKWMLLGWCVQLGRCWLQFIRFCIEIWRWIKFHSFHSAWATQNGFWRRYQRIITVNRTVLCRFYNENCMKQTHNASP